MSRIAGPLHPEGNKERESGDETYYVYNDVWYEPVTSGDDVAYAVTKPPTT